MQVRLAVIGTRSFDDYALLSSAIDTACEMFGLEPELIISGGAKGADTLAERYAVEHGIPTKIYLPDWKHYGKRAGLIRNKSIISESHWVLAFWDGVSNGTKYGIWLAEKAKKPCLVIIKKDDKADVEYYDIPEKPEKLGNS